jgi:glutamate/tyrosine decarboxylase-like PLP-dependent enzyme
VINPTVQSTKSGGPLAAAWAILHFLGDEGYLEIARSVLDSTRRIAAGVREIPGFRLLGEPEMNLVAFTSDEFSVFHVIDEMKQRGWYIQPQLGFDNSRENIHLSISPASARWVDALLADLRECAEEARSMPSGELAAKVRPVLASLDPRRSATISSAACSPWPAPAARRSRAAWPTSTR